MFNLFRYLDKNLNIMKRIIAIALVGIYSLFSISLIGQNKDERDLENFYKVYSYDGVSVQLVKSNKYGVKISGKKVDKLITKVSNGTLKIKMAFGNNFKGDELHVIVYYKDELSHIKATEGSEITSNDVLTGDNLELRSMEGSHIHLTCDVDNIYTRATTGGEIDLKGGKSDFVDIEINTGGKINTLAHKTKKADVKVSAGGRADLTVSKKLTASVTLGGRIHYKGNPEYVEENISLGGHIVKE
jgi:hypothetical protein